MPITALPTPPSRQDPTNFNDRADAFLGALPLFQTEANALQVSVNTSETNAVNASNAVIAATNIVKWVSGTIYANGTVVWSPINGLAYRRITASGSGTTDPSADPTNYAQVNGTGDVSTSGTQTINGAKTFSSTITGSISGNAATATTANTVVDGGISTTAKLANSIVTPVKLSQPLTLGTAVNTTSGTAIDFTSIPSWVKRITVMFNGVSTNGTSSLQVQLGAGSITTTGYLARCTSVSTAVGNSTSGSTFNTGFALLSNTAAGSTIGNISLMNVSGNIWVASGTLQQEGASTTLSVAGNITLSGALDRIRLTTVNGTDTFDAGSINILYE